ncbi:MAG TPA: YiaA/YiaB family inner membrane protein [Sphingobacteriaceae bacterium]
MLRSEKGFYAMAFSLSMFSAIAVQKNTRDAKMFEDKEL